MIFAKRNRTTAIMLTAILAFTSLGFTSAQNVKAATEHRGIWVGFCDFSALGLKNKSEDTYRANVKKFVKRARYYGCNEIYFHVRAFDDASWKSKTFKASKYLNSGASASKTAAETYSYDPLKIFIKETHDAGLDIHAWMNPYRATYDYFLNPGSIYTTKRIQRAVSELSAYNLDGMHFDDYFYHAKKGYTRTTANNMYNKWINPSNAGYLKKANAPTPAKKRKNVNAMLTEVYADAKKAKAYFSISPTGNIENAKASGCAVGKWLSTTDYCDGVIPQIYWTDKWGPNGNVKMYTNRLAAWKKLWTNKGTDLYIGLALYRTGKYFYDDRGWSKSKVNIRTHVKKLRAAGCTGYVLFSGPDLYDSHAKWERYKLKGLVKPIKAKSITLNKSKATVKVGKKTTIKVESYSPGNTNPKGVKFTSSNTSVASVSSKGKARGKAPGIASITVKAKSGVTKKCKITVK